jgi:ribosome biogenesis GTPase
MNSNLLNLGWSDFFKRHFEPFKKQGLIPARVACEKKRIFVVYCEKGELIAEVSGKFRYNANSASEFPAVGDWVTINMRQGENKAIIHGLLPRKTRFSRKVTLMKTEEQILAANIDIVFLVSGMDNDFNLRRIERYLTLCYNSDFKPIIVLNKSDLCPDIEDKVSEIESVAFDVPVHPTNALEHNGVDVLHKYFSTGITIALLGSSGVGKSTIINRLLGQRRQIVMPLSTSTSKGKHVTVHRELILVPTGGLIIDTPGMRELQLWGNENNLKAGFKDIDTLAQDCRFRNCMHTNEPGCAVKKAVREGSLDIKRYKNYLKLQKELKFLATRRRETFYHSEQEIRNKIAGKRKGLFR